MIAVLSVVAALFATDAAPDAAAHHVSGHGDPTTIHAAYVVPSDVSAVAGRSQGIHDTVIAVQEWFAPQTDGRYPVFVRDDTAITVATVVLDETAAELAAMSTFEGDATITAQIRAGYPATAESELFVFLEGSLGSACGYSSSLVMIPIDNCGIAPTSQAFPFGATYLVAHEVTHMLGAVPSCAPNHVSGHVDDDNRDIIYLGPSGRDWFNLMLDPGNDDYFRHGRDDCYDIDDSPLLGTWPSTPTVTPSGDCADESMPFGDVPSGSFAAAAIACIFHLEITTGTSPTTYSPHAFVTREQMAAFLARLYAVLTGSPAPVVATPFDDVPDSSFAVDDVARLYGLGITTGTNATSYSPYDSVTREQMAAFLARLYAAVHGSPAPVVTTPFDDVPSSSFAVDDVARLYGLGITTGTGASTYSPYDSVTREQMAAFLARLYAVLES